MGWIERPAFNVGAECRLIAKLLSGSGFVTWSTQAADVVVGIRAALPKGDDVVGHCRRGEDAFGIAVAAKRLGLETTLALGDASAATKTVRFRFSIAEAPVDWLPHSGRTPCVYEALSQHTPAGTHR
jgi:hypothetical protein